MSIKAHPRMRPIGVLPCCHARARGLLAALTIGVAPWAVTAAEITESLAVRRALEVDPQIKLIAVTRAQDSLDLQYARAEMMPAVGVNMTTSADPIADTAGAGAGLTVSQALPGGGTLSASANGAAGRPFDTNAGGAVASYGVAIRQPLVHGAWHRDPIASDLRLQRLDHRAATMQYRRDLGAEMSRARSAFWDFVEKQRLVGVNQSAVDQAERLLASTRVKFRVGQSSPMDTLSADLEVLKARVALLTAQVERSRARHVVSEMLMLNPDSVRTPDTLAIEVGPLPPPDSLLAAVRAYDPQRAIFTIIADKLREQLRRGRNDLLPDLSLGASYSHLSTTAGGMSSLQDDAVVSLVLSYALPTMQRRVAVARTRLAAAENSDSAEQYDLHVVNQVNELIETWESERQGLVMAEASAVVSTRLADADAKGYELGTVDRLTLLRDRDDARNQALLLIQQQIRLKQLEVTFDELLGTVLNRFGVTIE